MKKTVVNTETRTTKTRKYIVEAPEPTEGQTASSGGIRGENGKLAAQYKNPIPYQEPTQSPAVPAWQNTRRDEVKAWAADQAIGVGQDLLTLFWNETALPFIQAKFHQLGEKAVNSLTGADKQRPHEQVIIDVDPADLRKPEPEIRDEKIIHFPEDRAI